MRALLPDGLFRVPDAGKTVFLTFDDGPIPEATPEILDILDRYGVKATFFMVGDNVRKYPEIARMVVERGHNVGNHTMHHVKAISHNPDEYLAEVLDPHNPQSILFRPPHGWISRRQWARLKRHGFRLVFYDLVTRDYSRHVDARGVVRNVMRYSRPGSIIVFHDSLKSIAKLRTALPESIEWLRKQGYEFGLLLSERVQIHSKDATPTAPKF